ASVDDGAGAGVAGGDHTGRKGQKRVDAAVGGKLDDLGGAGDVAERGTDLVDQHGIGGDGDDVMHGAGLQGDVDGGDLTDEDGDVGGTVGGEPLLLDGDRI